MNALRSVLALIVWLYILVLFGRMIIDWIRIFSRDWRPQGVMLVIAETLYTLTDPPLKALRRVLPTLRIGGIGFDLGFLVLLLLLYLLLAFL